MNDEQKWRFIVELEGGVWLAPWRGDPGRTLVRGSARRFRTRAAAHMAIAAAASFRGFDNASVCDAIHRNMNDCQADS